MQRDTAPEPGTDRENTGGLWCAIFHWRWKTWNLGNDRYSCQLRPWCKLCGCYR